MARATLHFNTLNIMSDKQITVYGFDNVPEFENALARWQYWEEKATEKFGAMPTQEKAEWIAEKTQGN